MKDYFLYPQINGILAVGNKRIISSFISENGRTNVLSFNNKQKLKFLDRFLLRGIAYLFLGLFYSVYGLFIHKDKEKQNGKVEKSLNVSKESVIIFTILILSLLFAMIILGFLPIKLVEILLPLTRSMFLYKFLIATVKMIFIIAIFLAIKYIPKINSYYKFNNEVYKLQKQVNFLFYFVIGSIFSTFITSIIGFTLNNFLYCFVNAFITIIIYSITYEFLCLIKDKKTNKIFWFVKFLICEKSSQKEQKCATILLQEIEISNYKRNIVEEQILTDNNMVAYSVAYVEAKQILENVGKFEKSDLDYIFCEVLEKKRAELVLVKNITNAEYKKILKFVKRRASGEPVTKMFGYANFYGLNFKVTKDVLSPRQDTEILVETVLKNLDKKEKVVDLCTGSGIIAITLAKNSNAKIYASDISKSALSVAQENAKNLSAKVTFKHSNLFEKFAKHFKFDVIVSNPPYIPSNDVLKLDEEVKNYDPLIALDGGISGLDFYEKIITEAPKRLNKNGKIFFEIGIGQAQKVKNLLQKNFKNIKITKDYNKIDRVISATLK